MAKTEARCTAWFASLGVPEAVAQAPAVALHDVVAFISKRMRSLEVVRESKEWARNVRLMLEGKEA